MLKLKIALLLIVAITGCQPKKNDDKVNIEFSRSADQIVDASINKHGGIDDYRNLKTISYSKSITLYDSIGNVESNQIQLHYYELLPTLKVEIKWIQGSDTVKIIHENNSSIKYINNEKQLDSATIVWASGMINSSFYTLFQPFKLKDTGTSLSYLGETTLNKNTIATVIQPIYKENSNDLWWFYFDENTNLLLANMVKHNGKYSLIMNLEYDSSSHLVLHKHRKSYFVDSMRNINYLRASYVYDNYNLVFE